MHLMKMTVFFKTERGRARRNLWISTPTLYLEPKCWKI